MLVDSPEFCPAVAVVKFAYGIETTVLAVGTCAKFMLLFLQVFSYLYGLTTIVCRMPSCTYLRVRQVSACAFQTSAAACSLAKFECCFEMNYIKV